MCKYKSDFIESYVLEIGSSVAYNNRYRIKGILTFSIFFPFLFVLKKINNHKNIVTHLSLSRLSFQIQLIKRLSIASTLRVVGNTKSNWLR